mmetsp:Transcript_17743/g.58049  ORF Transcript_17743/g.58049 Transcript_17743/m.58049 type:complete len:198 (-) Transcript_17743:156-749(-)
MIGLKAPVRLSSSQTSFAQGAAVRMTAPARAPARLAATMPAPQMLHGMSGRKCMLTGKKANNGWNVSFSHRRSHKLQQVNLQYKRVYWEREKRYIKLRISTKAMKTIEKKGLEAMAKEAGIDLYKLRYQDADPARAQWLEENPEERIPKKKVKNEPKWRPRGKEKPLFVPGWKRAKMEKMSSTDAEAATAAFKERWN